MEDPKLAHGLVKREIVRIITPGTLTDENLLDSRTSNYLAAVVETRNKLGLAWVELSTGRFCVMEAQRRELADEIARLDPAELLVSETSLDAPWTRMLRGVAPRMIVTSRPSWDFQPEQARRALFDHFRVTTLVGFGIEDDAIESIAAGALIAYLRETQKTRLGHLNRLTPHMRGGTMALDEMTRRGLELTRTLREGKREGSLLATIDLSVTPMGARLLADWLTAPLTDPSLIAARHAAVGEWVEDDLARNELRSELGRANDLERVASRVGTGRASPRDLSALCACSRFCRRSRRS